MARRTKSIVLDSWAVVAYLTDEVGAGQVAEIIAGAHENRTPLKMSLVNVGEVWYSIARQTSEAEADEAVAGLQQLGIEFVGITWDLTRIAAAYKSRHRMSYADCFAAAVAKHEKAALVTGDREFKYVEGDVKIIWVA